MLICNKSISETGASRFAAPRKRCRCFTAACRPEQCGGERTAGDNDLHIIIIDLLVIYR